MTLELFPTDANTQAAADTAAARETRPCRSCDGNGRRAVYGREGETRACYTCEGAGRLAALDELAIRAAIRGRKGLRTAPPEKRGVAGARAYYVWRLARFHGGVDVTMPVMASTLIHGDPFVRELEALAETIAREWLGTDLAGAVRWGSALGYIQRAPAGLPATAYPSGPVLDGVHKPDEELLELVG